MVVGFSMVFLRLQFGKKIHQPRLTCVERARCYSTVLQFGFLLKGFNQMESLYLGSSLSNSPDSIYRCFRCCYRASI